MAQLEKAFKSSKKEPSSKQVFKAIFDDKALSLSEANEIDVTDARKVNTISGGNKAMNYGEMTPDSWSGILKAIGPFGKGDVFFDLGCGRGTLVVQAALEYPGMKCLGVELSKKRYCMAITAANRLSAIVKRPQCPSFVTNAEVSFIHGDMRKSPGLENATLVYLMNQDLPSKLVDEVVNNLIKIATSRSIQVETDGIEESAETDKTTLKSQDNNTITSVIGIDKPTIVTTKPDVDSADDSLACSSTLPESTCKGMMLLTLLRLRGEPSPPVKILTCRQTWVAGGGKDVSLYVYDLCAGMKKEEVN